MSRLNRVRSVDPESATMTVEAGCVLADVQAEAEKVGRCFPLSLSAEGSCQIGGNLSTNAGGINVIRYGNARDQVLGLEVVLADGRIWNGLRALRKDNAGYDMKQVFLGSEGTLGIITAATLKLYPRPGDAVTALIAIRSADQAAVLLGEIQAQLGESVLAFELMSDRCLRLVERHVSGLRRPFDEAYEWVVLTEIAAASDGVVEAALAGAIEKELALDVIVAKSKGEAERLWRIRHSISEAQRPEGACLKHDISVPIGALGRFLEQSKLIIDKMQPEGRLVAFGHVGDGNLHYNVMQPAGADPEAFLRDAQPLTEEIYALVAELGGSFSAEHGIGVTKRPYLERYRDEVELDLMRALKKALDPADILNPGKVI